MFEVFLENNTAFTIHIDVVQPKNSKIQGGKEQELMNKYNQMKRELLPRQMELSQKMMASKNKEESKAASAEMRKLLAEEKEMIFDFIKMNGDTSFAAYLTTEGMNTYLVEFLQKRYDLLSEKGKTTKYGKMLVDHIASRKK